MTAYLLYLSEDGRIINCMSGPDSVLQAAEKEFEGKFLRVEEGYLATTHYVDEEKVVEKPERPKDYYEFDYKIKKWVPDMELGKELTKARIQKQYEEASLGGFEWGGVSLASDRDSQIAIQMAVSLGGESAELAMVHGACCMVETKEDLQEVGKALLDHLASTVRRRAEALQRVNDATTVGELESIQF